MVGILLAADYADYADWADFNFDPGNLREVTFR
jgi:hypothetical protein